MTRRTLLGDLTIGLAGLVLAMSGTGPSLLAPLMGAMLLLAVMAAVRHAEAVGAFLGEPFGTLTLALAVTVIEAGLIVSLMLSGDPNPFLARDTIHAVLVLVLHGLAGLCIVVGTLRHREQEFSTRGANAFLGVLLPLAALTLVLPNHAITAEGPFYSTQQLAFVSFVCLALYASFVFVQTVRHPNMFTMPGGAGSGPHARPGPRAAALSFALMVLALTAVVLLGKALGPTVRGAIAAAGAPPRLEGVIIAAIVLMPEGVTAVRAAARDRLQTSINLALGSAVASIGLTIPVVALVAWWIGQPVGLGVDDSATVLLALSFLVAMITYGTGRTTLLSGLVHLILLAVWLFMLFQP
jgi:Ca2+:H+ antiporter